MRRAAHALHRSRPGRQLYDGEASCRGRRGSGSHWLTGSAHAIESIGAGAHASSAAVLCRRKSAATAGRLAARLGRTAAGAVVTAARAGRATALSRTTRGDPATAEARHTIYGAGIAALIRARAPARRART